MAGSSLPRPLVPVGKLYGNGGDDVGGLLHRHTVGDADVAHARAPQGGEMGAGAERGAEVAREGAYVRSFAAHHTHGYALGREVEELQFVDAQRAGLQLHLAALAGALVGALAVDLAGREGRGHLLDGAGEAAEHVLYGLACDVGRGVGGVHFGLEVEAGRGGAECHRGHIFLDAGLQLVDALGGAAGAHNHHSCGEGVERAGMTHLELAHAETAREGTAHALHSVERRPAQGLVDAEYFAGQKIHIRTSGR